MATFRDPDPQHVLTLTGEFAVGKEAAARAYLQCHSGRSPSAWRAMAGCSEAIAYRNLASPALIAAVSARIIWSWLDFRHAP